MLIAHAQQAAGGHWFFGALDPNRLRLAENCCVDSKPLPRLWITEITLSDGTTIDIPRSGVVLLVGPNNAGKSQSLKDIQGIARSEPQYYQPRTVTGQALQKNPDFDIRAWVKETIPSVVFEGTDRYHVKNWSQVSAEDIGRSWSEPRLGVLTDLFMLLANGIERLSIGHSEPAIDFTKEPPNGPIQHAYFDPALEKEIGRKCKQAFGMDVVIDR